MQAVKDFAKFSEQEARESSELNLLLRRQIANMGNRINDLSTQFCQEYKDKYKEPQASIFGFYVDFENIVELLIAMKHYKEPISDIELFHIVLAHAFPSLLFHSDYLISEVKGDFPLFVFNNTSHENFARFLRIFNKSTTFIVKGVKAIPDNSSVNTNYGRYIFDENDSFFHNLKQCLHLDADFSMLLNLTGYEFENYENKNTRCRFHLEDFIDFAEINLAPS